MSDALHSPDPAAPGRSDLHRSIAAIAWNATNVVVVATLATTMDPGRFAGIALVCVLCLVLASLVRHGLFDAALAGEIPLGLCRLASRWLAVAMVLAALVGMVAAVVLWLDLLAAAVVLGAGLGVSGYLARMIRFCDGRSGEVLVGDVAWLAATVVLALAAWAGGVPPAVGAVGAWIIGGAGWTALALGDGPTEIAGVGGPAGWWRLLVGTASQATAGTGALVGHLVGMAAVTAAGHPAAATMLEIGRLVGGPAVAVYSRFRLGPLRARSHGHTVPEPGRRAPAASAGMVASAAAVLALTTAVMVMTPAGIGSALDAAHRWWPLLAAGQVARLVVTVVSDTARPLLGPGAGLRIGAVSAALGAILPLALVLAVGDVGGLLSQLVLAGLVYVLIHHALRLSSLAHRRSPHIRPVR